MPDCVVVGGGIVGSSVAYHLARTGEEVVLLDREDPGRATDAGAGIVSPATSEYVDPTVHRFAIDAARYYPALVSDLERVVDDAGFDRPGILIIAGHADLDAFERARDRLLENRERAGYPPRDAIEEIDPDRARKQFPPAGDVAAALAYDDAGRVDGRTVNRALRRAGEDAGVVVRTESAEGIVVDGSRAAGVRTEDRRIAADNVVVAGGAWSGAFAADLGLDVPVSPQRGQIVHLDAGHDAGSWPIVKGFRDYYLVPWPDGSVVAGATREPDAGFAARATVDAVRTVLAATLRLAPGLADGEFREVRVGLRPVSTDGRPVLGESPVDGAYLATGHGPSGLTLGPYSGKVLADLVIDGRTDANLSPFAPDRFA